jgi:hypothetical protein
MLSEAIVEGQGNGVISTEIDPVLIVFSMIGLVMMHSATARFFDEVFRRKTLGRETMCRHITGLLLHGLKPSGVSGRMTKHSEQERGDRAR